MYADNDLNHITIHSSYLKLQLADIANSGLRKLRICITTFMSKLLTGNLHITTKISM